MLINVFVHLQAAGTYKDPSHADRKPYLPVREGGREGGREGERERERRPVFSH